MFDSEPSFSHAGYSEIVLCDLSFCQLLVPSQLVSKKSLLGEVRPARRFSDHGWIHYQGQMIGQIQSMDLTQCATSSSTVQPRISVGAPLSFEVSSDQPLPLVLADRAIFCYQFNPRVSQHLALFRDLRPRFVRFYPLISTATLAHQTQVFLQEEADFLAKNQRDFDAQEFYERHCPQLIQFEF